MALMAGGSSVPRELSRRQIAGRSNSRRRICLCQPPAPAPAPAAVAMPQNGTPMAVFYDHRCRAGASADALKYGPVEKPAPQPVFPQHGERLYAALASLGSVVAL